MWLFTVLLTAIPLLGVCTDETANILEHPQTQYALVGDSTSFYCNTLGRDAFWVINNNTITDTRLDIKERYERLGFSFSDSTHGSWGYHNLTVNVSAAESMNNTMIECRVVGRNYHLRESNIAYLRIFTDLRPYPPVLTMAEVRCQGSSRSELQCFIQVQPRWDGYVISELRVNIINNSNGVVLTQTTIPYNGQKEHHYFNQILSNCVESQINSSFLVSATAFSNTYGESEPSLAIEAKIDRALVNFSEKAMNHTVFFYPNGMPFLHVEIKLPNTICTCQKVAYYTIKIDDINLGYYEMLGPLTHIGPEIVTQNIISTILQRDHNYTMVVTVESFGEISTSKTYFFNTTLKLIPEPCNSNAKDDTFFFQLGMSLSLFMTVVMMSILVIFTLCAYAYHKREQFFITMAARRACNSMVDNPVYDGPVYESVQPIICNTITATFEQDEYGVNKASHNDINFDLETEVAVNRHILGKKHSQ